MRYRHLSRLVAGTLICALVAVLLGVLAAAGANSSTAQAAPAAQTPAPPPPLDVVDVASPTSLVPHLAYLRDPSTMLTAAEVASPARADDFQAMGSTVPNFGFTSDAVWVRLRLANPGVEAVPVILHLEAPNTSFVDLYTAPVGPEQAPLFATGTRRSFDTRPLPGRGFAFPLAVPPGGVTDYYLRVQADFQTLLAMDLWSPTAYLLALSRDEIAWGIVLGMLLVMSAYNLLLYISLRDRNHLLLSCFGLLVALSSAFTGGYLNRWLPPAATPYWSLLAAICIALAIGAFGLLAITFLDLRKHLRPALWLLLGGFILAAMGIVAALLGQYRLTFTLMIGALLPILPTMFVATIVRVRQGSRLALFFLLGQTLPIIFGIMQSVSLLGVGPHWPSLPLLVPINSLWLLVIMSLALADRINLLRKETDAANAALRISEERLSTYLDALPFNIQVHDPQLKPLYVNDYIRRNGAEITPGFYEQEYGVWVDAFPVEAWGTGKPYPLERLPLIRAAQGEACHSDDVVVNLPEGKKVVVESWAVPLKDAAGNVTAILTAFQDITARRAIETELADYRETLEQRVAQRTAELGALNANLGARVAELTAINEIGRRVAHVGDLRAIFEEVVHILADAFQVAGAVISLYDYEHNAVELLALADRHDGRLLGFAGQSFPYDVNTGYGGWHQVPIVFEAPEELTALTPGIHARMREVGITKILVAPLVARDQHMGAIGLLSSDGDRSFTADELRVAQTIAGQVATAIDTLRLIEEARSQRDVAEALRQTATALSRNLDQQNVFGAILEQLDQVFACEGAAVALVQGEELVTVAAKGLSADCLGWRMPLASSSASSSVLRSRQPLIVDDTRTSAEAVCCMDTQPIRGWLGAPLISGDEVLGVLSLDSIQPQSFGPAQADLLATFANQAAIAVVNARLYSQAQEMAVVAERGRLARDLHDAVTQTIFSASLIAAALPARLHEHLDDLSPTVQADLDALQMLTKGALAEMRTLLLELRPEHLADVPLETLLTQLAQAFTGRTGIPASVDANSEGGFAPPQAAKIAFYRVAQEALNNVGKHAKATCVTIRYSTRPRTVRLAVLDDGRGFALDRAAAGRLGLAIMRERAAAVGAQLTIDSEPGLGTHLFMVWNDESNTKTT
jgi:two-component system nitrate/nitrite sensor histidine kinase NarX